VSERGEEAGEQSLDLMDKNCVRRRGAPGELASDGKAQKGSKRPYVNAARVRGKLSHLIRGGLSFLRGGQKSAEAIVVGGVTSTRGGQGNLTTGRRAERLGSWVERKRVTVGQPKAGKTRPGVEVALKA
jgi:hypothetical protein